MTGRVLAGLACGLVVGISAHATRMPALLVLVTLLEPAGTLWIHAILATVVPLVVSTLIVGTASSGDARAVGRLGRRALTVFVILAAGSAIVAVLIVPTLLARLPFDAAASASLRTAAATGAAPLGATPTLRDWFVDLIPSNAVKAMADGAMLPLVVFTLAFALALGRVEEARRVPVVRFFEGVSAAMRVLIGWVLTAMPLGVFALTAALAARIGAAAAGALVYYVVLATAVSLLSVLALYPVVAVAARIRVTRFARAAAPAQAVAFGSRSSLASLPALLDGAERLLGISPAVTGFSLPLAVATFKFSSPAAIIVGVLYTARLYGIVLEPQSLVQVTVMATVLSFAVPGVPGGWLLIGAPVFAAMGLPVQAIGMLLAVDVIPDMLRTTGNVTADLAATAILGRLEAGVASGALDDSAPHTSG